MDVTLITCAAMPGLNADDRLLLDALRESGLEAEPAVWEDAHYRWDATRLAVVRSTWDYAFRRDQFLAWARRASRMTRLWNPLALIEWNTHKRYLRDLAERDVATVPTVVLERGQDVDLATTLATHGWRDAVVKAAVAQSGRYAMRVGESDVARGQAHLERLLPHEDMLLQPYVDSIATDGELSVVVIDGDVTHGVRKRARTGDFRVHSDHGGSEAVTVPSHEERAVALRAVAAGGSAALYGRVDLVAGSGGEPWVMELELVEPELFFRYDGNAVARLAAAIVRELRSPSPASSRRIS